MYDINQAEDTFSSGGTFKFGLNQNVQLSEVSMKTFPSGKKCLNLVFEKDDKKVYSSIWDVKEPGEGNKNIIALMSTVKHLCKAFAPEEAVITALSGATNFDSLCEKVVAFITPRMAVIKLDVFLEYGNRQEGKTSAYLQLPSRMYTGYFIAPTTRTDYEEIKGEKGLHYETKDGAVHIFTRSVDYMKSEATDRKAANESANATATTAFTNTAATSEDSWG